MVNLRLKDVIRKLRAQLVEAGLEPGAGEPEEYRIIE
jgi:hypothetical protein